MLVTIISVFLFLCIELSFSKSCFLPFSCFIIIALIAQLDTKERLHQKMIYFTVLVFLSYFIVIAYNY
jgi:hypothetical protein